MKSKLTILLILILGPIMLSSCSTTKDIPPGQMKKMTGEKSAARYAPGHNKYK